MKPPKPARGRSESRPRNRDLPPPDRTGGTTLMQALQRRASHRQFSPRELTDAILSRLLWAANGINRADSGNRTAPSACNWQEIDLYVIRADGAYRYAPAEHRLIGVVGGDLRPLAGVQAFVATAPVVLVLVADRSKLKGADEDGRLFYPACDAGYVSQNIYLFCAAEGLATVALVSVDKPLLHQRLGLKADQAVILTQPVGVPK